MRAFSIALLLPSVLGLVTPVHKRGTSTSLPITARYDANKLSNIVEADHARVRSMIENAKAAASKLHTRTTVPLTNDATTYTISVGVGSPPTNYTLIVDTGSSNTWVGANTRYVRTATSVDTGHSVTSFHIHIPYAAVLNNLTPVGDVRFWLLFSDTLTLTPDLVFTQSIGVASHFQGFGGFDGILGIGPIDLTEDTVAGTNTIPTIVDTLYQQNLIPNHLVGVFFQPVIGDNTPEGTGQLDLGNVDFGEIVTYVPITSTEPANAYWGVDLSISSSVVGDNILSTTAGIVDTGTTLVHLASDAFQRYQKTTGAVMDAATGLLRLTKAQFLLLPSLFINYGGDVLEFTPDAQAWPQKLNSAIGGSLNDIYLIVSNLGTPSGEGFDFILGQTFLQRFYSVYDTTNSRVGLAETDHTFDTTNVNIS